MPVETMVVRISYLLTVASKILADALSKVNSPLPAKFVTIWVFSVHVLVLQRTAKIYNTRAEPLFSSLNLLFVDDQLLSSW